MYRTTLAVLSLLAITLFAGCDDAGNATASNASNAATSAPGDTNDHAVTNAELSPVSSSNEAAGGLSTALNEAQPGESGTASPQRVASGNQAEAEQANEPGTAGPMTTSNAGTQGQSQQQPGSATNTPPAGDEEILEGSANDPANTTTEPVLERTVNEITAQADALQAELEEQIRAHYMLSEKYEHAIPQVNREHRVELTDALRAAVELYQNADQTVKKLHDATPNDFETLESEARAAAQSVADAFELIDAKLREALKERGIDPDW